jgi:hypothetical protein
VCALGLHPEQRSSLRLQYLEDVTFESIPAYRFTIPAADFKASAYRAGFCVQNEEKFFVNDPLSPYNHSQYCLSDCLLDVSNCSNDRPIVLSMPHFLYCGQDVVSSVDGMAPNAREHQTHIDLHPTTGLPLHVVRQLQINAKVVQDADIQ